MCALFRLKKEICISESTAPEKSTHALFSISAAISSQFSYQNCSLLIVAYSYYNIFMQVSTKKTYAAMSFFLLLVSGRTTKFSPHGVNLKTATPNI